MKEWWEEWHNKYAIVLFCAAVGYGGYEWICWRSVEGQTWAAWVQAIGSVAAIVGAIWIAYAQHKKSIIKDKEASVQNTLRMLQSIHDEIKVMSEGFVNGVGLLIDAVEIGEYLEGEIRITETRFRLYAAFARDLALLSDDALRQKIIEVHTRYEVFILAIEFHADFLAEHRVAIAKNREKPSRYYRLEIANARSRLVNNFYHLRAHYLRARTDTEDLIKLIAAEIARIKDAYEIQ